LAWRGGRSERSRKATANSHTINAVSGKFVAWQSGKINADDLNKKFEAFAQQTQRTNIRVLADFFQLRQEDPRFKDAFDTWNQRTVDRSRLR